MKLLTQSKSIIDANNINLDTQIAKCVNCNELFSFKSTINIQNQTFDFDIRKVKVPIPKRFNVKELNGILEIKMRWFTWFNLFLTFFTIFWNSFMIAWFLISIQLNKWDFVLFGTLHAGVGVYLIYMVLARYINSTTVTISRTELSVRIGPLPWPGNRTIPCNEILQLYTKRIVYRGKSTSVSYEVHSILRDRTHLCLLKSLEDSNQALYFEQKIEEKLQIIDEPVSSEMER